MSGAIHPDASVRPHTDPGEWHLPYNVGRTVMVTAGAKARLCHAAPAPAWIGGIGLVVTGTLHYPSPLLGWGIVILIVAAVATVRAMICGMIAEQDRRHAEQREIDRTVRQTENEEAVKLVERIVQASGIHMNGSPHTVKPNVVRLIR